MIKKIIIISILKSNSNSKLSNLIIKTPIILLKANKKISKTFCLNKKAIYKKDQEQEKTKMMNLQEKIFTILRK
jgi:predicted ATP-grasp superfamily ATP-dependent carboligase